VVEVLVADATKGGEHPDTVHGEFHSLEFRVLMASLLVELVHRRLHPLRVTVTQF
jgi:hypothetical protein